jgi:hypothetical protein
VAVEHVHVVVLLEQVKDVDVLSSVCRPAGTKINGLPLPASH